MSSGGSDHQDESSGPRRSSRLRDLSHKPKRLSLSNSQNDDLSKYAYLKTGEKSKPRRSDSETSTKNIKNPKISANQQETNLAQTKKLKNMGERKKTTTAFLEHRRTLKDTTKNQKGRKKQSVGQQMYMQNQTKMLFQSLINGMDQAHPNEITKMSLMNVIGKLKIDKVTEELLGDLINLKRMENDEEEKETLNYEEFRELFQYILAAKQT